MESREWRTIDKSAWGDGPWQDEPDKAQWTDEATGLPCLLVRVPHSGHLCGYVGVPPGHPWHGKDYNACTTRGVVEMSEEGFFDVPSGQYVDVHGGLTFADKCQPHPDGEGRGVCHVAGPGEPEDIWWLGFDCAHSGDVSPASDARWREQGRYEFLSGRHYESYKTAEFVKAHCRNLAAQAKAAQP